MAQVKFGSLITEAAGKVGGQILQRGRTGSQLRNLSQPVRIRTNAKSVVQQNFSSASSLWKTLNPSHRNNWNSLAATLTRLNKWGDPYIPSGFQIFCEFNLNISVLKPVTKISVPQTLLALPDLSGFSLTANHSPANYTLDWTYISGDTDWSVVPYLYGTSTSGQSFSGRTPIYMGIYSDVASNQVDLTSPVALSYPPIKDAGMSLVVGYRLINLATGQGTPMVKLSTIYT